MRNPLPRILAFLIALAAAGGASGQDFVRVYFSAAEQSAPETIGTTSFEVRLSRASSRTITVPIFIDQAASTASPTSSSTESDGDYHITENPDAGFDWDYEAQRGIITFSPGETFRSIPVRIINDRIVEGEEQIVFRIDAAHVTVARPVEPSALTFRILDTDPVAVFFNGLEHTAVEGRPFNVDFVLSSAYSNDINVVFGATPAEQPGLDREHEDWPANDTFRIPAGATRRTFSLPTRYDSAINDTRYFDLRIVAAREAGTTGESGVLPADQRVARLALLDSGPLEVGFRAEDDDEAPNQRTIVEFGAHAVTIGISAPQDQDLILPLSFGGTAVRGDNSTNRDTYEYRTNVSAENTLTIPKGQQVVNLQVTVGGRARPTPGATIVVDLGTPRLADGTQLPLGSSSQFTFTIEHNPPTTLSFGYPNPEFDGTAASDEPRFIASGGFVAARSDGFASIPIFISNAHGQRTEFQIEILSEGTSAVLFTGTEEDWDFYVTNSQGNRFNAALDRPISLVIPNGNVATALELALNREQEIATYPWTRDPATDKTVRLRLQEVNTNTSGVTPGQAEFVLTIREFPDIDVTHLFLDPVPGSLPPRHPQTSLHELDFDFELAGAAPSVAGMEGYRSYKVVFQPGVFDAQNRSDPANDRLSRTPLDASGSIYHLDVTSPFRPRYPSAVQYETLIRGEPRTGITFRDEHANVRLPEYVFFRPLNLPVLDPARGDIPHPDGQPIDADFSFRIEFTHGGASTDGIARLAQEGAVKVFLTRDLPQNIGSGGVLPDGNVLRFLPQEDGSVFIEVNNPDRHALSVQYLDSDGRWRTAQGPVLREVGTRLLWIDHGPPRTHRHPREVDFRLYRFLITN